MRKFFYLGLIGLTFFEILNVYFIMPMPGSQRMESIDFAYFLYNWRWGFRAFFLACALTGIVTIIKSEKKWLPIIATTITIGVAYLFNFQMTAEKMFEQPSKVVLLPKFENRVAKDRLVIGIENNGEAKAYPISFLAYHHQVQDTVGGKAVIVTYCNVCRTGRVFEPKVNGKLEKFRLVGMDHFNAMLEDATTKSWWRQVNGEAIVGSLKGEYLPEIEAYQVTVEKWLELFPNGTVMQADANFMQKYDSLAKFEKGFSTSILTRTDSIPWQDKSWVIGLELGNQSKAYDWNELKNKRIINDLIGDKAIVVALSFDEQSFVAFVRPSAVSFTINSKDQLVSDSILYDFTGSGLDSNLVLKRVKASQEFWHSWLTFHPDTQK
jgi:hypothetical protein